MHLTRYSQERLAPARKIFESSLATSFQPHACQKQSPAQLHMSKHPCCVAS